MISVADTMARQGSGLNSPIETTKQALEMLLLSFGNRHVVVAQARGQLSRFYVAQGKVPLALNEIQIALGIVREHGGEEGAGMPSILRKLGNVQILMNQPEDAVQSHEQALKIRQKLYGARHHLTGWSHDEVGIAYLCANDLRASTKHLQMSVDILYEALGDDHGEVLYPLSALGDTLSAAGKWEEAIVNYRESLKLAEKQFAPDFNDWIYPLTGLARAYMEQGDYQKAQPLLERAHKIRLKEQGVPYELGKIELFLAQIYIRDPETKSQALELAHSAEENLADGPDCVVGEYKAILKSFLSRHMH